ncbi:Presenilin-domain-containing protein [Piromyces finnis]|uniref:Presenilin n=1 Tax=Piromyces finnis TaxID=1754191 RepID=A0A1Y1VDG9_9FUNG|nr:Presenilin-domain-containing protein [Piromyces finnis]|eukprot:ORX53439.1 Presenilin-domain-containing protein [Piromyces finnis]
MNNNENRNNNNNNNNNIYSNQNEASTSTSEEDPKLKQELDEYIRNQKELLSSPMDDISQEEYSKILKEYRALFNLYRQKQITPEQKITLNEHHQILVKYQYQHLNPEQQQNYLLQQREQAKIRKIKEQQQKKKDMYDNLRYYAKEISSIIRPVILCICLSILWVKLTRQVDTSLITSTDIDIIGGSNSSGNQDGDEAEGFNFKGLLNSFLNAGLIIGNIVIATFVILLLFKFNCSKVLYGLFMFTVFMLIGIFGYNLLSTLIYIYNIPMDWITLIIFMFNLSIVGVIVIFWKGPSKIQQGYLILMSSLMAFSLTGLADWTTWILLALLACWDLIAVLCPFGPLKMLVEHSDNNKQMIPQALIYSTMIWMMAKDVRINIDGNSKNKDDGEIYELNELKQVSSIQIDESEASSQGSTQELIDSNQRNSYKEDYKINIKDNTIREVNEDDQQEEKISYNKQKAKQDDDDDDIDNDDTSEKQSLTNRKNSIKHNSEQQDGIREEEESNKDEGEDEGLKLGLGDFVFYSVLIARAAMHDWITTFACAIAVLFGLTVTIFLLSIYQKALPALPISIVFGIIFYVISSFMLGSLMEYLTRIPVVENNMKNYSDLKLDYNNGCSFVYL